MPFVRPNDEERVAADVDEVGGRVAVDETVPEMVDEVTEVVLGPTGRPMPVFPDPQPLTTHGRRG